MAAKKNVALRVPTKADLKRLAKAHTKAEDALRRAEISVELAKRKK